jgi:hypothetical protein
MCGTTLALSGTTLEISKVQQARKDQLEQLVKQARLEQLDLKVYKVFKASKVILVQQVHKVSVVLQLQQTLHQMTQQLVMLGLILPRVKYMFTMMAFGLSQHHLT